MSQKKLRCDCGKWVAVERDGEFYVWCRECKKEVKLTNQKQQKNSKDTPIDNTQLKQV